MKKIILICLFCFFTMSCSVINKKLKCSDCYDIECILKITNKMVEKRYNDSIDKFEIEIEEEEDFYTIIYTNIERLNNPLCKGGKKILIKISKKNCKIVDYIIDR